MPITRVPKHQVATELLDRAMALYLRKDSYYAALHLAGAAEEILSVYARNLSLTPSYDSTKSAIVASGPTRPGYEAMKEERAVVDLLNGPKNAVKHKQGVKDEWVELDPRVEAGELIQRALITLMQLHLQLGLRPPLLSVEFHNEHLGLGTNEA